MQIRALDPHDDEQIARFHEILWRAEKEDGRPWNPMWTLPELTALFREDTSDSRNLGVTAWAPAEAADGMEMVGAGFLMLSMLDNLDKAFAFAAVEPERRRQGTGSAVLEGLLALARGERRTTISGSAAIAFEERESAAVLHWAGKRGFTVANTEIQRSLRLPVDVDLLSAIEAETAPHHAGYSIATFSDGIPDRLLASYCRLANQLILDAPSGDLEFEEEAATPESVRERRERDARAGRTVLSTLALRGDEVVAHTDLFAAGDGHEAHQQGTLVHRDHRGHRLGIAVKVANLRRLQELRPDVSHVETVNAETNAHMVSINERLGFRPVSVVPTFKRVLDDA